MCKVNLQVLGRGKFIGLVGWVREGLEEGLGTGRVVYSQCMVFSFSVA